MAKQVNNNLFGIALVTLCLIAVAMWVFMILSDAHNKGLL